MLPADTYGCGHYRLIWAAQELRRQGEDVVVIEPSHRSSIIQGVVKNSTNELVDVHVPDDADVVVLQRVTHRHVADSVRILRQKGVAVVIDMDDDLHTIHPSNAAFTLMHPRFGDPMHSYHNNQRACEAASLVTVSTPELLRRYGSRGNGHVIFNHVPRRYLDVVHYDSPLLGWGGAVFSHPDDLQTVGTSVAQLQRDGARFRVVGAPDGVREALGLDHPPEYTGNLDLTTQWPYSVAALGVGIAPLADTRFNSAKSWLKPLEYAALGVPCVVSPRVEYVRINRLGVGLLARSRGDWFRTLGRLLRSPAERVELGARGREVAAGLTVEENAWRWYEAWTVAYERDR